MSLEFTCTRRIQFCAGHRVFKHESKCNNLHGHNYVAFITAKMVGGKALDELGRVIDFAVIKQLVGGWIDEKWDHGFIVSEDDMDVRQLLEAMPGQKVYVMPCNPTAENMAAYLLGKANELLPTTVAVTKVRLWETENCYAEV